MMESSIMRSIQIHWFVEIPHYVKQNIRTIIKNIANISKKNKKPTYGTIETSLKEVIYITAPIYIYIYYV